MWSKWVLWDEWADAYIYSENVHILIQLCFGFFFSKWAFFQIGWLSANLRKKGHFETFFPNFGKNPTFQEKKILESFRRDSNPQSLFGIRFSSNILVLSVSHGVVVSVVAFHAKGMSSIPSVGTWFSKNRNDQIS